MKSLQQSGRNMGPRWIHDHDQASRQDLARLEHEMHTGLRDLHQEMDALRSEVRADFKTVNEGMNGLREVVAGLAGKVDGLSRSVDLLTKFVVILIAAAIAAGGWNVLRNSNDRGARQPILAMAAEAVDGDAD